MATRKDKYPKVYLGDSTEAEATQMAVFIAKKWGKCWHGWFDNQRVLVFDEGTITQVQKEIIQGWVSGYLTAIRNVKAA